MLLKHQFGTGRNLAGSCCNMFSWHLTRNIGLKEVEPLAQLTIGRADEHDTVMNNCTVARNDLSC